MAYYWNNKKEQFLVFFRINRGGHNKIRTLARKRKEEKWSLISSIRVEIVSNIIEVAGIIDG